MEVMFDWSKPTETNRLVYLSRFSILDLFTYINEFELMMGSFEEKKTVYTDSKRKIIKKVYRVIIICINKLKNINNINSS